MRHGSKKALVAAGAVAFAVALGACGSSGTATTSAPEPTTAATGHTVVVKDPWARATAPGAQVGAIYAEITSGGEADALVGVTVPADVAAEAQLHITAASTTTTTGPGPDVHTDSHADGEHTATSGSTGMQQVATLEIPAGGSLTLAPGGNHVMLIGLAEPLVAGETFTATLQFEKAPAQTVTVSVRDS